MKKDDGAGIAAALPSGRGWRVVPTAPEHAGALAELQRVVFPSLDPAEWFEAAHYRRHLEVFPEGQFVVLASGPAPESAPGPPRSGSGPPGKASGPTEVPVAATTTLRLDFNPAEPRHTFPEILGGRGLSAHDPSGEWLYGADLGVHPAWRRKGLAGALYEARQRTVSRLRLRGQLTVGMLNGYGAVADRISAPDYYGRLIEGALFDPTVSVQLRLGFEPRGLIPGYVRDPRCRGYGVLLVRPR